MAAMTASVPATHLLRRFAVFAFTVVFLLTTLRAGHALWRFPAVEARGALGALFVQGLRFDLALVGLVCLVPITIGPLLGMFAPTRAAARVLVVAFLVAGLALVLVAELVTPWFLAEIGARPGVGELAAVADPPGRLPGMILGAVSAHPVAAGLGALLALLVLVAFWARLEVSRLLRFPLSKGSAAALALLGPAACALAIWSGATLGQTPPTLADASDPASAVDRADRIVDELVPNSAWKTLATATFLAPR